MTDVHDPQTRSKNMAAVKTAGTRPEQLIQESLKTMELDFTSQEKSITGKPDFFVAKYNTALFVHGCYWHGHNCHLFKTPQTRTEFWMEKINQNRLRDKNVCESLKQQNIKNMRIWECALRGKEKLNKSELNARIEEFFLSPNLCADIDYRGFRLISQ